MKDFKTFVLMLGGAGLICGITKALIPSKVTEKQMELLLSLMLLCLCLRAFGSFEFQEAEAFSMPGSGVESPTESRVAEEGVLLLTRLELAGLVEQTLTEETELAFHVVSIQLSGQQENVSVSELCFSSLNDRSPEEIAEILSRRLNVHPAIREVSLQ